MTVKNFWVNLTIVSIVLICSMARGACLVGECEEDCAENKTVKAQITLSAIGAISTIVGVTGIVAGFMDYKIDPCEKMHVNALQFLGGSAFLSLGVASINGALGIGLLEKWSSFRTIMPTIPIVRAMATLKMLGMTTMAMGMPLLISGIPWVLLQKNIIEPHISDQPICVFLPTIERQALVSKGVCLAGAAVSATGTCMLTAFQGLKCSTRRYIAQLQESMTSEN